MKRFVICLLSLSLFGCAEMTESINRMLPGYEPQPTKQERFRMTMEDFVGRKSDSLVSAFGYPSRTFLAPNGNTVYAYERSASSTMIVNSPSLTTAYGYGNNATATNWGGNSYAVPMTQSCNLYFEVDSSTHIVRWLENGNSCY